MYKYLNQIFVVKRDLWLYTESEKEKTAIPCFEICLNILKNTFNFRKILLNVFKFI